MKKFLAMAALLANSLVYAQEKNFIDQPFVEVSGQADTLLVPDEIFLTIVLAEKDTRDKVSVEQQEKLLFETLQSLGINTAKELSLQDMSSSFKTYLFKNRDILKRKEYQLKLTSATMVSKVFTALEKTGISNTTIDRVDHSQKKLIGQLMKSRAIENARTSAQSLIKPLGQELGKAIFIKDNEINLNNFLAGRVQGIQIRGLASLKEEESLPEIEFEKIKVEAGVSVRFILRP